MTALELGLTKMIVEVVADQEATVAMFRSLGFDPEALLADHVRDQNGDLRDLMLMAHSVEGSWGVPQHHRDRGERLNGTAPTRDGRAELHWESEGSGVPILLIAGLALGASSWWRTVPVLADALPRADV